MSKKQQEILRKVLIQSKRCDTIICIKCKKQRKGAKYTKTRRPVKLVYYEEHETKNEAMSREYAIKHLTRKEKEILIKGNGNLCGSWMVKGDMIKAGEFEKIKKLTREAKELAE